MLLNLPQCTDSPTAKISSQPWLKPPILQEATRLKGQVEGPISPFPSYFHLGFKLKEEIQIELSLQAPSPAGRTRKGLLDVYMYVFVPYTQGLEWERG